MLIVKVRVILGNGDSLRLRWQQWRSGVHMSTQQDLWKRRVQAALTLKPCNILIESTENRLAVSVNVQKRDLHDSST